MNNIYFLFKNIYHYNNEQAEDRSYRIGQKNDVNIYYQLFDETISTKMWEILKNKKETISAIIGDKKLSEDEIITLLTNKLDDE
jgi:SNF2 family DNA or RNA helicase